MPLAAEMPAPVRTATKDAWARTWAAATTSAMSLCSEDCGHGACFDAQILDLRRRQSTGRIDSGNPLQVKHFHPSIHNDRSTRSMLTGLSTLAQNGGVKLSSQEEYGLRCLV